MGKSTIKGSSLDEGQKHLRKLSKKASKSNKPTSAKAASTKTKGVTKLKTLREYWKEKGK